MCPPDGTFEVPADKSNISFTNRLSDDWLNDPEECFDSPPISEARLKQLAKAAELTLQERIQMRIKHGIGWHNHL